MAERIDHVSEATKITEQTLSYRCYGEDAGAIVSVISAQVHATLALVEQQRIANRLKVAELDLLAEVELERSEYDFRIRPYLDAADWASIEVDNEEPNHGD